MKPINLFVAIFLVFVLAMTPFSISLAQRVSSTQLVEAIRVARKYLNSNRDFASHEIEKCFTGGMVTLAQNWDVLSPIHQREFADVFARPSTAGIAGRDGGGAPPRTPITGSLVHKFDTPHFRIHYSTNDRHAPPLDDYNPANGVPDYVDRAADAAEKSYRIEIKAMGFKEPYDDFWATNNGGNIKADIYLVKFGSLGLALNSGISGRFISAGVTAIPFYLINSRMWDYYGRSEGNRYIDTTIAHEYFHGVQLAYNAKMPPWTMEATCTWMESRVYDGGRAVFNIDPKYQEDLDQLIVPVELAMELGTKHKIFLLTPDKKSIRDDVSVIRMPPDEKTGKGLRWRIRDHQKNEEWTKRRIYEIRKYRDELRFHEDFDDIPDIDNIDETDGYHYYTGQLHDWFIIPDISLDETKFHHHYGSMIWFFYITERFEMDIVRKFFAKATQGAGREYRSFASLFEDYGTTLAEAFKMFTVWNYYTADRDEGRHYFNGNRFPRVAINPTNIHNSYPIHRYYNDKEMPEAFGARYVVFNPPEDGQVFEDFAVRIDGMDIAPIDLRTIEIAERREKIEKELSRLGSTGLRGWGVKFIVHKSNGITEDTEVFTYHRSQEAQMNFQNFGKHSDITKIVLILINIHPDIEQVITPDYDQQTGENATGGSISYNAGVPPAGRLTSPKLLKGEHGGVHIEWKLEDLTEIKQIAIVRKRFELRTDTSRQTLKPFQNAAQVFDAGDRDNNGVPDGDINIVGSVEATDTNFFDSTTFQDINVNHKSFNPRGVAYFYAVVPISQYGLMGTPAIGQRSITPDYIPEDNQVAAAPSQTTLHQSYPNPFNPEVWIPYELATDSPISIDIYTPAGEKVRTLDIGMKSIGRYIDKDFAAYWDGRTATGERVASGVYFYVLRTTDYVGSGKMVIVK